MPKDLSKKLRRCGFVSIAGRPNAGKSTLLNALVGEKIAITAYQAQTTRTSFQGVLTTPSAQIIFIDTPGIHKSDTLLNKRMMDTVRGALQDRDLVLYVADATRPITQEDEHAVSALSKAFKAVLVLNKIDKVDDKRLLLPLIQKYSELFPFQEAVPVSAILRHVREEVPHASAILVDTWEETKRLFKIAATIHVERQGQKIILIGNKGEMLKKIGTTARIRMEELLQRKVFLSLFIAVKPNWREDPSFLDTVDWRTMLGSESKAEEKS